MQSNKQHLSHGFTLIEVLISIVIITIILVVSTNILQSSLASRETTFKKLDEIQKFNLASSMIKRDLRQALNVPMRDYFGNAYEATFLAPEGSSSLTFTALVDSGDVGSSWVKRIEYVVEDGSFYRRQYFSDNPYLNQDYFESTLFDEVEQLSLQFSDGDNWSEFWPKDPMTSSKMPSLVKLSFSINGKSFEWVIAPNIDNVYQP